MGPVAGTPILPGAPGLPAVMLADSTRYFDDINRIVEETVEGGESYGGRTVMTYWDEQNAGVAAGRLKATIRFLTSLNEDFDDEWLVLRNDSYSATGGVLVQKSYRVNSPDNAENVPAGAREVRNVFDAEGNRTETTDPRDASFKTVETYDFNRVRSIKDAEGHTVEFEYDVRGNKTREKRRNALTAAQAPGALLSDTEWLFDEAGRLVRQIRHAPTGDQVTETLYDTNGNPVSETSVATGGLTETAYDGLDRIVRSRRKVDANRWEGTEYDYDSVKLVQTRPMGGAAFRKNSHDALHRVVSVQCLRPGNLSIITETKTEFDGLDRVVRTSVHESNGTIQSDVRTGYDLRGQPVTQRKLFKPDAGPDDQKDFVSTTEYDEGGRAVSVEDPSGTTATLYNDLSQPTQVDRANITAYYDYYPGGLLKEFKRGGQTTSYFYDRNGRRTVAVAGTGEQTLIGYDGMGRQIGETVLKGTAVVSVAGTQYDALGDIISATRWTDPATGAGAGDPANFYTRETATGRLLSTADARGNTTWFRDFDLLNRPTRTDEPSGEYVVVQRDGRGNVVDSKRYRASGTLILQEVTVYDELDRVVEIRVPYFDQGGNVTGDPDGNRISRFDYDADSRLIRLADPAGRFTTWTFNGFGLPSVQVEDAGGAARRTEFGFDPSGRMTSRKDHAGNETTYTFDASGNVKTVKYQGQAQPNLSMEYDSAGRLWKRTDGRGFVTVFTYDGDGRIILKRSTDPAGVVREDRLTYYADRLVAAERWVGGVRIARSALTKDGLDRVLADEQTVLTYAPRTVGMSYDPGGNRLAVEFPGGRRIGYLHDVNDRLAVVTEGISNNTQTGALEVGPTLADYTYDGDELPASRTYRPGTAGANAPLNVTRFGYSGGRDLVSITSRRGPGEFDPLVLGYLYGVAKDKGRTFEAAVHAAEKSKVFTEDSLTRLVGFAQGVPDPGDPASIPAPMRTVGWTLDKEGNCTTRSATAGGLPLPPQVRTHNALHQLTAVASAAPLETRNLEYDADGNISRETRPDWPDTVWAYSYDEENRLVRLLIVSGDGFNGDRVEVTQDFDALGRRVRWAVTEVWTEEGNEYVLADDEIVFVHDGMRIIEERGPGGLLPLRQYVWSADAAELIAQDSFDALGQRVPALRRYALHDALRSVAALLRPDGSVEQLRHYDPYGRFDYELLPVPGQPNFHWGVYCPLGFTGARHDGWTGLVHFPLRELDPSMERWLQRDPAGYVDGNNPYPYAACRPTVWTDPTGAEILAGDAGAVRRVLDDLAYLGFPNVRRLPLGSGRTVLRYKGRFKWGLASPGGEYWDGFVGSLNRIESGLPGDDPHREVRLTAINWQGDTAYKALPTVLSGREYTELRGFYRNIPEAGGRPPAQRMTYRGEFRRGVNEGYTLGANNFAGWYKEEADALRAKGGVYTAADWLSGASRELLVTAATMGYGGLVANAARGTGWVARGARALLKAQAAWDRLQQVRDLADLAVALEGMREQIAEFLAHAEADGCDEDRAVEVLTDLIIDKISSGNCLPAGTPVWTDKGPRPIERVAAGDLVRSLNPRTGAWELRPVTATFEHLHLGAMVRLSVSGETLEATADHPFFVTAGEGLYSRPAPSRHTTAEEPFSRLKGRWVSARDLRVGDCGTSGYASDVSRYLSHPLSSVRIAAEDAILELNLVGPGQTGKECVEGGEHPKSAVPLQPNTSPRASSSSRATAGRPYSAPPRMPSRTTDSRLRPPRRDRRKGGSRGRLRVLPLDRPGDQDRHLAVPLPAAGDAVVVPAHVLQANSRM
jgi:RHS repeat-associated protein